MILACDPDIDSDYAERLARLVACDRCSNRSRHAPTPSSRERYSIITDAIKEMEPWSSFHPEYSEPEWLPEAQKPLPPAPGRPPAPSPESYVAAQPFIREPKIGRNDPCPCGSDKKYKKCCGKG
jgi:preprotein translocase subunit SecA